MEVRFRIWGKGGSEGKGKEVSEARGKEGRRRSGLGKVALVIEFMLRQMLVRFGMQWWRMLTSSKQKQWGFKEVHKLGFGRCRVGNWELRAQG